MNGGSPHKATGAFNPHDWLQRFAFFGGHAWITGDTLYAGWSPRGFTDEQLAEARSIFSEIEEAPEHWQAVRTMLRSAIQPSAPSTTVTSVNCRNEASSGE